MFTSVVRVTAVLAVLILAACGSTPQETRTGRYRVGQRVEAMLRAQDKPGWEPAEVLEVSAGRWHVQLVADRSRRWWVTSDEVRAWAALEREAAAGSYDARAAYAPGQAVEAEWRGSWFSATVLKAEENRFRVRFEGFGPEWDSWLGRTRLRQSAEAAGGLATLRERAEGGDAEAMIELGLAYEGGAGVPQDAKEAVRWYRAAAEQGSARGLCFTANAYSWGLGYVQDKVEAAAWYERAVTSGSTQAMWRLGLLYEAGEGVSASKQRAVELYQQAADAGDSIGMRLVGNAYAWGVHYPVSPKQASAWYRKAIAAGDTDAPARLEQLLKAHPEESGSKPALDASPPRAKPKPVPVRTGPQVPGWSRSAPLADTGLEGRGFAVDASSGEVLLFGGAKGRRLSDATWHWGGNGWARLKLTLSPPPRSGSVMVHDGDGFLLVGGRGQRAGKSVRLSDVWRFDGADWKRVGATKGSGPQGPLGKAHVAFDPARNRVIAVEPSASRAWSLDCASWQWSPLAYPTLSPGIAQAALVSLPRKKRMVLLGQVDRGARREPSFAYGWDGQAWQPERLPPFAGEFGRVVVDPVRNTLWILDGELIHLLGRRGWTSYAAPVVVRRNGGWVDPRSGLLHAFGAWDSPLATGLRGVVSETWTFDPAKGRTLKPAELRQLTARRAAQRKKRWEALPPALRDDLEQEWRKADPTSRPTGR